MAACYSGGTGFKSRKERELLILSKKEYTQIHMLTWLQKAMIKIWKDSAKSKTGTNSFSIDTAKLWNNCPEVIKLATSIGIAKSEIKKHCKTFQL